MANAERRRQDAAEREHRERVMQRQMEQNLEMKYRLARQRQVVDEIERENWILDQLEKTMLPAATSDWQPVQNTRPPAPENYEYPLPSLDWEELLRQ